MNSNSPLLAAPHLSHGTPCDPAVATFNSFHLGDQLVHLHFMRALAKAHPDRKFLHAAPSQHRWQLEPLVADLPNLSLCDLTGHHATPAGFLGVNAWRGFNGWCYQHPHRNEFAALHLSWFGLLATELGFDAPFTRARDLLFDYPALICPPSDGGLETTLVINSPPLSGQFTGFNHDGFDGIIRLLRDAGHNVVTTSPSMIFDVPCTVNQNMDVTAIGRLSQRCRAIIAVATGPIWPTFNIWNADSIRHRIILNDTERVDMLPEHTVHCNSLSLVPEILKDRGLL